MASKEEQEDDRPYSDEEVYRWIIMNGLARPPFEFDDPKPLRLIFNHLWPQGRFDEALACLRLLERIEPLNARELNLRGFWLLLEGASKDALVVFEKAVLLPDADDFSIVGKAYALFYLEDYKNAYQAFQQLLDRGTALTAPFDMAPASKAMMNGGKPEKFVTPPLPGVPLPITNILYQKKMTDKANAIAVAVTELERIPAGHELLIQRLILELLIKMEENHEAFRFVDQLPFESQVDGIIKLLEGFSLRRLGENEASHQSFEAATFLIPLHPKAWGGYAAGLMELGQTEEALLCYQKAVFLDATNELFIQDTGRIYAQRGDFEQAIPYFSKAIALGSQSYQNYLTRGICYRETGQHNQAKSDFEYSLSLKPDQPQAAGLKAYIDIFGEDASDDRFVFGDPGD